MSEDKVVYPSTMKAMAYDTEGKPMMCKKHGLPLGQMIMGKDAFMGWCAECEDGPSYKAEPTEMVFKSPLNCNGRSMKLREGEDE